LILLIYCAFAGLAFHESAGVLAQLGFPLQDFAVPAEAYFSRHRLISPAWKSALCGNLALENYLSVRQTLPARFPYVPLKTRLVTRKIHYCFVPKSSHNIFATLP